MKLMTPTTTRVSTTTLIKFLAEEIAREERNAEKELEALHGWTPTKEVSRYRHRMANSHRRRAKLFRVIEARLMKK
jgi:hypothetical protein